MSISETSSSSDGSSPRGDAAHSEQQTADSTTPGPRYARLRVLLGAILSFAIFWYAGWILRVPANPGFSGSLFQQPSPAGAVLITVGLFVGRAMLSNLIAVGDRDAGVLCAAIGLFALSARSGPIRYTLMAGAGPQVYLALACEMIALGGVVLLARMAQGVLAQATVSGRGGLAKASKSDDSEQIDQKLI